MEKRGRKVLNEWGVIQVDIGLLGGSWFTPYEPWPKRFKTRKEARDAAALMTGKYRYLRPEHVWTFKAVRLRIVIGWAS